MEKINLPPIGKKIRLIQESDFKINLSEYGYLGECRNIMENIGWASNEILTLPPNTEIKIEAFKAWSSVADWPYVKVTIYPESQKSGKCYLPMFSLNGLEWEDVTEPPKPILEPQKRIIFNLKGSEWITGNNGAEALPIWHNTFDRNGYTIANWKKEVIINPQNLEPSEIINNGFNVENSYSIGEVIFRFGKESTKYEILLERKCIFSIRREPGIMWARLSSLEHSIKLFSCEPRYFMFSKDYKDGQQNQITPKEIQKTITEFLNQHHGI